LERLGEEPFDSVVSAEVIEHLYTPRDFARGCFAALKPGGKFLCTTPYHGYLKNILICVLNQFDNHFNPLRDGGHIKFWSLKTLTVPPTNRSWLLQYRFSAVQEGCPFFGSRWSSRPKTFLIMRSMQDEITALILTYNEAPNIARTLNRLRWASDIIIVDSFSTDETLAIANRFRSVEIIQRRFDSFPGSAILEWSRFVPAGFS